MHACGTGYDGALHSRVAHELQVETGALERVCAAPSDYLDESAVLAVGESVHRFASRLVVTGTLRQDDPAAGEVLADARDGASPWMSLG